jgi:hypothetical protein
MAASLVAYPANAQPGVTRKTYCFVDAVPNPVGAGDDCLIRFGIFQQTPNVVYGYSGLTVTMVNPDGTTTTLGLSPLIHLSFFITYSEALENLQVQF